MTTQERRLTVLDENDSFVQFKLDILKRAMPARDAVVFGDMYIVEGGYTKKCLDYGCERALLIDTLETPNWLDTRKAHPTLNFYKGDFSDTLFMQSIAERYEIGIVFDILLHQAPLLNTIHLMLEKVEGRFVIAQPMLREQGFANTLVYLPGNPDVTELYPLVSQSDDYRVFDVHQVNQSHWLWGMTRSFLLNVLKGEGFELTYEQEFRDLPNPNWYWWGAVVERKARNPTHWSNRATTRDLYLDAFI